MTYRIITHHLANKEFLDAVNWYEDQLPGLGHRFLEKVKQKIKRIQTNPEYFGKLHGRFRQAKVDVFPYCIVYEFFPLKRVVHISAIFHYKRHPGKKFRRLKE